MFCLILTMGLCYGPPTWRKTYRKYTKKIHKNDSWNERTVLWRETGQAGSKNTWAEKEEIIPYLGQQDQEQYWPCSGNLLHFSKKTHLGGQQEVPPKGFLLEGIKNRLEKKLLLSRVVNTRNKLPNHAQGAKLFSRKSLKKSLIVIT